MREREPYHIQTEQIRERPSVFPDEETCALTRKFAAEHYLSLKKPLEQHELENVASVGDLVGRVEETVAERAREAIPRLIEKTDYRALTSEILTKAVCNRNFDGINAKDEKEVFASLGLALVAERARTRATADALKNFQPEQLSRFGMTPSQRDIVTLFLEGATPTDPEFIRFKARAMSGNSYPERPTDSLRESTRLANTLAKIRAIIEEKGADTIFEEGGEAFLDYVAVLERSYNPTTEAGAPFTSAWRTRKEHDVNKAFEKFLETYPNFPLIILPAMDSYVPFEKDTAHGFDPEIRLLWQSPDQRERAREIEPFIARFAETLQTTFPEHVTRETAEEISRIKPLIADEVGGFGVNIGGFRVEAQAIGEGEANKLFFLFENRLEKNAVVPAKNALRNVLGVQYHNVIDSPQFTELIKGRLILHELSHSLYEYEGDAPDDLDDIEEMKADVIAYAAFHDVFGQYARKHFGKNANIAMNLAILGDPLSVYSSLDPQGEWRPYWMSSLTALNLAAEHGFIIRSKETGKVAFDDRALAKNMSKEIFSPHAEKILQIFKDALAKKPSSGVHQERAHIATPQEHALVESLRERIGSIKNEN